MSATFWSTPIPRWDNTEMIQTPLSICSALLESQQMNFLIVTGLITCSSPEMHRLNMACSYMLSQRALHIIHYQNVNYHQMVSVLTKESSLSIGGGASGNVLVLPCVRYPAVAGVPASKKKQPYYYIIVRYSGSAINFWCNFSFLSFFIIVRAQWDCVSSYTGAHCTSHGW
jgi:hypothetical protein